MAIIEGTKKKNLLNGTSADDTISAKNGNDTVFGYDGNDTIYGELGNDKLYGGIGNDYVDGGDGNDKMFDDLGADTYEGGTGIDTISYASATSGLTAYLGFNTTLGAATGDTYSNVENVIGSAFDDYLQGDYAGDAFGGGGDDHLYGSGNSGSTDAGGRIRGDGGYDTLRMDYGNTQAWLQNGQGYDTISFFIEGQDLFFIKLSDFGLGNTLDSNEVHNSNTVTAVGTNAQFIFEYDAQNLWFDENGSSAGGLTLIAHFDNSTFTDSNIGIDDFAHIL